MIQETRPNLNDLFDDLDHPNPNINHRAFQAMYCFWPEESKLRLLHTLNSHDIEIRRKSVKALSYFGTEVIKIVDALILLA